MSPFVKDRLGLTVKNDDPGRIRPGANVSGALFHSHLTYSSSWKLLKAVEREHFRKRLPFIRNEAPRPGIDGYLSRDLIYSAGGRALERATVRSRS